MSPLEAIKQQCQTLRLPGVAETVPEALRLAQQQDWSLESFLLYLLEQEVAARQQRRIDRLLREARLPPDKTLARFDQSRLPLRLRRQLPELIQGQFIPQAGNLLIFGRPGTGKTHLVSSLAYEWVQQAYSVWFTPTYTARVSCG